MIDITKLTSNLYRDALGCWLSGSKTELSYPEEGNSTCYAVEDDSFWFQHRNRCITEVVKSLPPTGPLFDVGGGNGVVAAALERAGQEVVLIEPGAEGARNALRRGVRTVISATLEQAGFADGTLPAIGLFDVLEHIGDDEGFLRGLRQKLQVGGKLFLTVPAFGSLWSAEDDDAGHFRRYTLDLLSHRLGQAGFAVDYRTYMFWFLPAPVLVSRTVPTLLGLRKPPELDQTRREHNRPRGWKGRMLDRILGWELRMIRNRRRVPFGGSCLVAAHRVR